MKKQSKKSIWPDYQLLDCGDLKKLERFGDIILIRPEPNALWPAVWSPSRWKELAHAECVTISNNKADWKTFKSIPDSWAIQYPIQGKSLAFNLQLTRFKHVGVFPEQQLNWRFIFEQLKSIRGDARALNLFAYTGGASLAAKAAGADVVHVDSIKQVVSWAKQNMTSSGLKDIRWVVEDALKFVSREHKRNRTYHGVILDPPAFGLGAKGERWKLENSINELLEHTAGVLDPETHFVVLNTYSPGFTPLVVENLLKRHFPKSASHQAKELFLRSESGLKMPAGVTGWVQSK